MSEKHDNRVPEEKKSWIGSALIRFALITVVLAITSFLTPGFSIVGFWSMIIAAIVITLIDYLIERLTGLDASPFGKGIKGFIVSAIILYIAQFFVPNMAVSIWGALIASVVIGIIDAIMPSRVL